MTSNLFADLEDPVTIELAVRTQLAGSLDHLLEVAGPHIADGAAALERATRNVRAHRQDPGVMARYFDLVSAVRDSDVASARQLALEIDQISSTRAERMVVAFDETTLGDDFERFPRLVFSEDPGQRRTASPKPAAAEQAGREIDQALGIIAEIDPRVASELDALCSRIILMSGRKDDGKPSFGGVTSLMVWGAIFLNIDFYDSLDRIVDGLTHEVTHATLLGLSAVEPLVNNPPEENYTSPLRSDPRPMDGLYHATIVTGRLSHFYSRWAETERSDPETAERHRSSAAAFRRRFLDGKSTIDSHGDLSGLARTIIDSCEAALAEHA